MAKNYTVTSITERMREGPKGGFVLYVEIAFRTPSGASSSISIEKAKLESLESIKAREQIATKLEEAAGKLESIFGL